MCLSASTFPLKIHQLQCKMLPKVAFIQCNAKVKSLDSILDFEFMMVFAAIQRKPKSEMKKKDEKIGFNKNQNRSNAPFPFENWFYYFYYSERIGSVRLKFYYSMFYSVRMNWAFEILNSKSTTNQPFSFVHCSLFIHLTLSAQSSRQLIAFVIKIIPLCAIRLLSPHKPLWLKIPFWMSSINFIYHYLLTFFEIPWHFWAITFYYYYIKLHLKWEMFNLLIAANQRNQEESLK